MGLTFAAFIVDTDTMEMVALELNIQYQRPSRRQKVDNDHKQLMDRRKVSTENAEASTEAQVSELLVPRPPVVCIMGVSCELCSLSLMEILSILDSNPLNSSNCCSTACRPWKDNFDGCPASAS